MKKIAVLLVLTLCFGCVSAHNIKVDIPNRVMSIDKVVTLWKDLEGTFNSETKDFKYTSKPNSAVGEILADKIK